MDHSRFQHGLIVTTTYKGKERARDPSETPSNNTNSTNTSKFSAYQPSDLDDDELDDLACRESIATYNRHLDQQRRKAATTSEAALTDIDALVAREVADIARAGARAHYKSQKKAPMLQKRGAPRPPTTYHKHEIPMGLSVYQKKKWILQQEPGAWEKYVEQRKADAMQRRRDNQVRTKAQFEEERRTIAVAKRMAKARENRDEAIKYLNYQRDEHARRMKNQSTEQKARTKELRNGYSSKHIAKKLQVEKETYGFVDPVIPPDVPFICKPRDTEARRLWKKAYRSSEKVKAIKNERAKQRWKDPEVRLKASIQRKGYRENKKLDPSFLKNINETDRAKYKEKMRNPDLKKRQKEKNRDAWKRNKADPEYLRKRSERYRKKKLLQQARDVEENDATTDEEVPSPTDEPGPSRRRGRQQD